MTGMKAWSQQEHRHFCTEEKLSYCMWIWQARLLAGTEKLNTRASEKANFLLFQLDLQFFSRSIHPPEPNIVVLQSPSFGVSPVFWELICKCSFIACVQLGGGGVSSNTLSSTNFSLHNKGTLAWEYKPKAIKLCPSLRGKERGWNGPATWLKGNYTAKAVLSSETNSFSA